MRNIKTPPEVYPEVCIPYYDLAPDASFLISSVVSL